MADIWIQLENRYWDTMPNNIDRITAKNAHAITGKAPVSLNIFSPGTGVTKSRLMYAPLRDDSGNPMEALIFRRYKAPILADGSDAWTVPDDRKVNPWDINEKDPTDNGTMGTIPGTVVECNVGDTVLVHFRNMDMRLTKPVKARAHSMHVHGFVFSPAHDGAFPLSPADPSQPILAAERTLWNDVGVTGANKMGDRVPPGGTFNYTWNTFGWPTTAGVWLYHDHSFCDDKNMGLGAIGVVVIHNPADTVNDFALSNTDFPDNSAVGNPIAVDCFPFPFPIAVDRGIIQKAGIINQAALDLISPAVSQNVSMSGMKMSGKKTAAKAKVVKSKAPEFTPSGTGAFKPEPTHLVQIEDAFIHLTRDFSAIRGFCFQTYKTPPAKALYLQLFHKLTNSPGMNMNGRSYLGNTPSLVAGTATKMRFGVVGMGASGDVHTFHIHGHRWIIPGPHGTTESAIKFSPTDTPVSQFEDTRIFGPANSFGFTINGAAGSFMRAGGPGTNDSKGEWHMHCHFLDHMMLGMMGSLLIVDAGQAVSLPRGEVCPDTDVIPAATIVVKNFEFTPKDIVVPSGTIVTFNFVDPNHTATTVSKTGIINSIEINGGASSPNVAADSGITTPVGARTVTMIGNMGDKINFQCGIHFAPMVGSITIM